LVTLPSQGLSVCLSPSLPKAKLVVAKLVSPRHLDFKKVRAK
jgi:hypothetical protein